MSIVVWSEKMRINQKRNFEILWDKYSVQVASGDSYADNKVKSKEIITSVVRLPQHITSQLVEISGQIGENFSELYIYPADTIHTTVLYLSPYIMEEELTLRNLEKIKAIIRNVVNNTNSITAEVCGLGLFPTTIFAQIYIKEPEKMVKLRQKIAEELKKEVFVGEKTNTYEKSLDWGLSFSNIIRFCAPVSGEIVKMVYKNHNRNFGTFKIDSLELVNTDKYLSKGGTIVYEKYAL